MKIRFLVTLLFIYSLHSTQFLVERMGPFENIYGSTGIYGNELNCKAWRNLYVWASGDYVEKSFEAIGYSFRPIVYTIPIGAGMKYLKFFPIDSIRSFALYAGAGGVGTYIETKEIYPLHPHAHKWGAGAILKTGFLYLKDPLFFDLFMSGSFQYFDERLPSDLQVYANGALSGWMIEGGTGLTF